MKTRYYIVRKDWQEPGTQTEGLSTVHCTDAITVCDLLAARCTNERVQSFMVLDADDNGRIVYQQFVSQYQFS